MRINGINGTGMQTGKMNMTQATDSVSKNIQNQIANAQKQLQELSANKDMSIEEKMKRRQEIQQQITDLNNQLKQHQIEQRKEKQQAKGSSMDDMLGGSKKIAPKTGAQSAGLSQQCMNASTMRAVISADSAMAQAQVQGSVATRMEGRAGVLEAEIKQDGGHGIEAKQEELAEVQQKAVAAEAAQMNTLAAANKELEATLREGRQTESAKEKEDKKEAGSNNKDITSRNVDNKKDIASDNADDKKDMTSRDTEDKKISDTGEAAIVDSDIAVQNFSTDVAETVEAAEVSASETAAYTHVDIRL